MAVRRWPVLHVARFAAGGATTAAAGALAAHAAGWGGVLAGFPAAFLVAVALLWRWAGKAEALAFAEGARRGIWGAPVAVFATWGCLVQGIPRAAALAVGMGAYAWWLAWRAARGRRREPLQEEGGDREHDASGIPARPEPAASVGMPGHDGHIQTALPVDAPGGAVARPFGGFTRRRR